jgi:hypothetical protein
MAHSHRPFQQPAREDAERVPPVLRARHVVGRRVGAAGDDVGQLGQRGRRAGRAGPAASARVAIPSAAGRRSGTPAALPKASRTVPAAASTAIAALAVATNWALRGPTFT